MIQIAFVGIDKQQSGELKRIVEGFFHTQNIECRIVLYDTTDECVFCLQEHYDVYMIDLDTQDEIDKIEFARELRALNSNTALFFISASDMRAQEGYGVRAEAFLLKPIDEEKLCEALKEMVAHSSYLSGVVTLSDADKQYRLDIRTITRLKKNGQKNEVFLVDRRTGRFACKITIRRPFDELATDLLAYSQMRLISASSIINSQHIKSIDKDSSHAILSDGEKVRIDPTMLAGIIEAHLEHH